MLARPPLGNHPLLPVLHDRHSRPPVLDQVERISDLTLPDEDGAFFHMLLLEPGSHLLDLKAIQLGKERQPPQQFGPCQRATQLAVHRKPVADQPVKVLPAQRQGLGRHRSPAGRIPRRIPQQGYLSEIGAPIEVIHHPGDARGVALGDLYVSLPHNVEPVALVTLADDPLPSMMPLQLETRQEHPKLFFAHCGKHRHTAHQR